MTNFLCKQLQIKTKTAELSDITFSLKAGSVLGIVGDQNSGKELLLQTILKAAVPEQVLQLNGIDFSIEGETVKQHLAFILKDCPFSMSMTAKENATLYGTCYQNWDTSTFEENCQAFSVPTTMPLKQLSKEECIRFQLAFAISYDADLYLLNHATEKLNQETKQLLLDTIIELKKQNKLILFLSEYPSEYDQVADDILWLDKGKQLCFEQKDNLLSQFQMLKGSEKQLRYVHEVQPNLFLVAHILPSGGEALIPKVTEALPLRLESRTPQLQELVELQNEYYKANHSYFIGANVTDNLMAQETKETASHKLVNTAEANIPKSSEPKPKKWNHLKWEEPKKRDDFWDQSDIEDSRTHKEHYENPFS